MYLSSRQTNEDTPNSFMSQTSWPGPSQLFAAGVSGAAVGGAIAALLILVVFAAAGVTILIVVLVKRRNVHKSTNCIPAHACNLENDYPRPELDQSAEQMELQQNTCYGLSGSYKQEDPVFLDQSANHVQLQQNMCYATISSSNK